MKLVQPGWFTAIGSVAPTVADAVLFKSPGAASGLDALLGSIGGFALDTALGAASQNEVRIWWKAFKSINAKLQLDFASSSISSWAQVVDGRRNLRMRVELSGMSGALSKTIVPNAKLNSLRQTLALSGCWDGYPLARSVELVRSLGPLVINVEGIHCAVASTMLILKENFGLPIELVRFDNAIEQVRYLNRGGNVDFMLVADMEFLALSSLEVRRRFSVVTPCFNIKQHIIGRKGDRSYHAKRLWISPTTTAEETIRIGATSPSEFNGELKYNLDISEIPNKIEELDHGEYISAWEPFVSIYCSGNAKYTARLVENYTSTVSIVYNREKYPSAVRDAFLDCFISAWNRSRIYQTEACVSRLLKNL